MTKLTPILLFIMALVSVTARVHAQGCSDAGFCSIGALGQQHTDSAANQKSQQLTLLSTVGLGDEKVFVATPGVQYDVQFSRRWGIQAKLTTGYASGNLGSAIGLGDAIISGIYTMLSGQGWKTSVTAGIKIPLNRGNLQKEEKGLPLQYQSSLGTLDIITGLSVSNAHWQFAVGWQQPVSGRNGNTFLAAYWNDINASKYAPGNEFGRKADLLLRSAYLVQTNKSIKINFGLLGIYHLGNDTYINKNISNDPIPINGSQGLTLNITGGIWLPLGNKFTLGATGGFPVIARDIRPDGLTRKFVIAPELSYHF